MRKKGERGFTLIEITAVLILLGLLAAIIVPRYLDYVAKNKVNLAKTQIATLKGVLSFYRLENGTYPTTEQGLDALYKKPVAPPEPANWTSPYIEDPIGKDPWGNDYVYTCPGVHNPDGYDLSSLGADGKEGGEGLNADVTNWH